MTERDKLKEIARGNAERHLGDCCESADDIHDEVYTLAFDALNDHGCGADICRDIARELAMEFAAQ